jgi:hypothetical protein
MRKPYFNYAVLVVALLLCASAPARAAEDAALAQQARAPTASLMAFYLRYDLITDFHNDSSRETLGTFLIQPVIPFRLFNLNHIARLTVPIITHSPKVRLVGDDIDLDTGRPNVTLSPDGAAGLSDIVLLDVVTFKVPSGRLGVGPLMSIPTATDSSLGSKKWQLGPAGVAILRAGNLQYGGLLQGYFTVAGDRDRDDVNALSLQPFASWSLPGGWGIGFSEMSFAYDLEKGKWTNLPFGLSLEKLVHLGSRPARAFIHLEYNFQDDDLAPKWTLRLNIAPLFPLGGG